MLFKTAFEVQLV